MADAGLAGFQALVAGETENLPDQESNTVRIFMSSTFTDMKEERNRLIQEVFPELRRYCQERGLEFEVVDMRWGVRDSATADHLTSFLCLNEIDRCKRLSQGPYFVGFLGNKYGYRPLKATIPSEIFTKLVDVLSQDESINGTDIDLIRKWYVEDTNAEPSVFVLQPITTHLPDYYDASDEDKQRATRQEWWDMFENMRRVFDAAARLAVEGGVFSKEEMHPFVMSVTEEEIRHGLKGNDNTAGTCLFFVRELEGLTPSFEERGTVSLFADCQTDRVAGTTEFLDHPQALLSRLKSDYLPSLVPAESLHRFSVPWTKQGLDPEGCPEHASYLDQMCDVFQTRIKAMIDQKVSGKRSGSEVNPVEQELSRELLHHASFCKTKCSAFQGREELLGAIKSRLSDDLRKPVVLHGVSGSGKTSVMAMVARNSRDWVGEGCVTVLRFLGTSAHSTSIHAALQSMCRQICFAYGAAQPSNDHLEDFSELVQVFHTMIKNLPTKDKPLLLLFDSIDQLNANNSAHKMNWLPKTLSENTFIVLSMLPVEGNCLENIKMALTDPQCYVAMGQVPKENGILIMEGWLKSRGRRLTQEQVAIVSEAFAKCPQPLFLKLLFEDFVKWPSYKDLQEVRLPSTVIEAITNLFQDLEDRHGMILVAATLGYLTAGKSGLTEAEIEDVLSCDDTVLNDVYQYWDPPDEEVVRIPPSVWKRLRYDIGEFIAERQSGGMTVIAWYHRQFIETARRRYLGSEETKEMRHRILADVFLGEYSEGNTKPIRLERRNKDFPKADRLAAPQPLMFGENVFNLRKLQELPYHLMRCRQVDGIPEGIVQHIMYNFKWILTKLRAFHFLELMNDFTAFDEESAIMIDALYLSGSILKEDSFSLAGQLIGRMSDLVDRYPNIAGLLDGAKAWVQSTNLSVIIPRGACLIPPGGQLKTSLAGHPARVEAVACTSSANVLVTVCKDQDHDAMANVWDEANFELIHTLQVKAKNKAAGELSLAITPDDRHVIFGCQVLGMFELSSGECLWKLDTGARHAVTSLQIHDNGSMAAAGTEKGSNVFVWDLKNQTLITKLQHPANVQFAFFEGDSELLSLCNDGHVRHWSLDSKDCLHSFQAHRLNDVKIVALARSRKTLVSGGGDGKIKLSRYAEKPTAPEKTLEGHKKAVSCLVVLSECLLASGSADFTVRVWNMDEGTCVLQCLGHAGFVTCLWHSPADPNDPNSKPILVSGSKDDVLKVWDLDAKESQTALITTLEGHSSWIANGTGSQKRIIYSASNDKSAKVWDYTRETVIKRERHKEHAFSIIFSPDKSTVISSGTEETIKFSRFHDCSIVRREEGFANHLMASADGTRLIGSLKEEGVVRVWDMKQASCDGGAMFDLPEGHKKPILFMTLGHDDEVITGSEDTTLKVWSVRDRTCRLTMEGHVKVILFMTPGHDDEVITGSEDTTLKVWSLRDRTGRLTMEGHVVGVELVKVAGHGADTLILSGDGKGMLKIWSYTTGKCLLSAKEHNASMRSMAVSPDGCYAVTGSNDKKAFVWSLTGDSFGQVIKRLTLHAQEVIRVAFTSDGSRIISSSHASKKQLHVWHYLEDDPTKDYFLVGHTHAVMDLWLSPDDQYLITASRDCTIKAWHLPSRQLVASFDCKSQIKYIDAVVVGDDRFRVAAENKTGTILLLDLLLPNADRSETELVQPPASIPSAQAESQLGNSSTIAAATNSQSEAGIECGEDSNDASNGKMAVMNSQSEAGIECEGDSHDASKGKMATMIGQSDTGIECDDNSNDAHGAKMAATTSQSEGGIEHEDSSNDTAHGKTSDEKQSKKKKKRMSPICVLS